MYDPRQINTVGKQPVVSADQPESAKTPDNQEPGVKSPEKPESGVESCTQLLAKMAPLWASENRGVRGDF